MFIYCPQCLEKGLLYLIVIIGHGGGDTIHRDAGIIGSGPTMSNNVAEYQALVKALRWIDQNVPRGIAITVYSDSQMLVMQMNGRWKPNKGMYIPYYYEALHIMAISGIIPGKDIFFEHIAGTYNPAHKLAVGVLIKRRTG